MNGKAFKMLQETLHNYPPYLNLLKPLKRLGDDQNSLQHPPRGCKHGAELSPSNGNYANPDNNNGIPWSRYQGQIHHGFHPSSSVRLQQTHGAKSYGGSTGVNPNFLCSGGLRGINSTIWANVTNLREKYLLQGKWPGGRGRSWTPPGLEGGEDGDGVKSDVNYFQEDNFGNDSYPDYGYDNYYDYDHSDWLTSHLDEVYDIMRSSQMDTNIALTVFLAIVFIFGVTGNILVLAVFSRGALQQQASTVFIKALAVTDLIICLVVLPGVLLKEWYIPYRWDALCQGWELIRCSTIPLSTLILASVAVDRYVKICRVDRSIQITTATAKKILLATATISICLGIPPMLRMGVYQAGEGPGKPKIYLGLCMGNDLLVSKETVDRYWQAMAAKFLLVLMVVMVMYGLVFRTVYRQSRRWGRCAAKTNDGPVCKGGRSITKGWLNKAFNKNKEEDDEDDDDDGNDDHVDISIRKEGKNKNECVKTCRDEMRTCGNDNEVGKIGSYCCNDKKCCYSENCDKESNAKFSSKIDKHNCRDNGSERRKNCDCKSRAKYGKCTRNKNHSQSRTVETIKSEKKRSSFSLSFLCGSKSNANVISETPAQLSTSRRDELPDDGVTSLDDGHVSFFNAPSSSSSSSKQHMETNHKKRPRLAIFSCTSELTVSRSAYVSNKSYYKSSSSREDEDDVDVETGKETKHKMGIIPMPNWLRRWKRLIAASLFTTSAQKLENKKSVEKLALRQKAKIHMMNQEASCDIEGRTTSSLQNPNIVIQNVEATTENTISTVVNTTETNWPTKKRTKLKKWSQSLDSALSSRDSEMTRKKGQVIQVEVKGDQVEAQNNTKLSEIQNSSTKVTGKQNIENPREEFEINPSKDFNNSQAVTTSILHVETNTTTDQVVTNYNNTYSKSWKNGIDSKHQGTQMDSGRTQNLSFTSVVPSDDNNKGIINPNFQNKNQSTSANTIKLSKSVNDDEMDLLSQIRNSRAETDKGPFRAWLNHQTEGGMTWDQNEFEINNPRHQVVHSSISCPLPSKIVIRSKGDSDRKNGQSDFGNKVHPLNSHHLFSSSVPNIRETIHLDDSVENDADEDHQFEGANNRWLFHRSEYVEKAIKIPRDFGRTQHQRDYALLNIAAGHGNAMSLERKPDENQILANPFVNETYHGDFKNGNSNTNSYQTKISKLSPSYQPNPDVPMNRDATLKDYHFGKQNCSHHYKKQSNRNQEQKQLMYQKCKGKRGQGRLGNGGESTSERGGGGGQHCDGEEAGGQGVKVRRDPQRRYNGAQVKTAQVLFLVTVVYVLSFAPVLLMSVEAVPPHPIPFYGYFIHSAANPILYSFINEAFRSQLYRLLCPHCCKKK